MAEEIVVEKTGEEGIMAQLNDEIKNNPTEEPKAEESTEKPAEEPRAEEPKAPEEPEFDLGLDEDGKTPLKFTKKQILEMKKSGMLQSDYTKKTQELAAEKANMKELVDIVDYLKKNPKKAEQIVKILEQKEEEAQEKEVDLKTEIEGIDKLLADLPQDDPYAQVLRSNKAVISQILKQNQALQSKIEGITNGQKSEESSKLEAECHQTLTEVMSSKQKALKFTDEEEAGLWKKYALTYLINNPKEYEQLDKEGFAKYFNEIGDKVYSEIVKIGEKRVNQYIKNKGGAGVIPGSNGASLPAEKTAAPINKDNLQGNLESMLQAERDKT